MILVMAWAWLENLGAEVQSSWNRISLLGWKISGVADCCGAVDIALQSPRDRSQSREVWECAARRMYRFVQACSHRLEEKRCPHTAYIYMYMLSWLFRFNRLSFKLRSMGVRNVRSRRLSMCCFLLFFGWELFRAKATCVLEFPSTKPVGCVILCTASCLAQARKGPSVHRPDASPVRRLRDTCGCVS